MRKWIILLGTFVWMLSAKSQELNCAVQVVHPKIQGTNTQIFQSLQGSIYEFMNNTKWTDHVYGNLERIECNLLVNVSKYNGNDGFIATIQVQSRRPVYNTSYNSVLLNFKEEENEFIFKYLDQQTLEFNPTMHLSNLTSVLAFYAYLIIGVDYDSFSNEGGTAYFMKAQSIVNNAQSSNDYGWKAYESKKQNNRFFMINDILSKQGSGIRRVYFRYHRLGLDLMSSNIVSGRTTISDSFRSLQTVFREKRNSLFLQMFFSAKADEIVNIFSEAPASEKTKAYNILKEIDLINSSKYEKMIKSN